MKIAIISDIHDNLANLKNFLSFAKKEKVTVVFCCGDVISAETLDYLISNFEGKVFLTLGNADLKEKILERFSKKDSKLTIFRDFGEVELDNLKIAFSHSLEKIKPVASLPVIGPQLSKNQVQEYDFVFFGHTHRPSLENSGKTKILNPGNLAGLYYKATFAILDTKTKRPELKILEKIKKSAD